MSENEGKGGEQASADEAEAAAALGSEVPAAEKASDEKRHANKLMVMQSLLKAAPKEKVRIPKETGPQSVIINGARFNIPAGIVVEVPAPVAELLRGAELI